MDDLSSLVKGIVNQLGRTFFLAGFLPMLILVAVNQFFIFSPDHAAIEEAWNLFPDVTEPFLGLLSAEWLTAILVALMLALMLLPLNLFLIRLYEGQPFAVKALLYPAYARSLARHKKDYAAIQDKRLERRRLFVDFELGDEDTDFDEEADFALQEALDVMHHEREKKEPIQTLPYDRQRVKPTGFGNMWAVMEEYAQTRYGMDSMIFWPYVRLAVAKDNPDLLDQIDNQKLLIDITLHLSVVMFILAVEGIVFAALRGQPVMLWLLGIGAVLFYAFYRTSVSYVYAMAVMVTQCFDLYRYDVLDAFELARPDDLDEEFWVWSRLAAFLRRGESFYFDMLERIDE